MLQWPTKMCADGLSPNVAPRTSFHFNLGSIKWKSLQSCVVKNSVTLIQANGSSIWNHSMFRGSAAAGGHTITHVWAKKTHWTRRWLQLSGNDHDKARAESRRQSPNTPASCQPWHWTHTTSNHRAAQVTAGVSREWWVMVRRGGGVVCLQCNRTESVKSTWVYTFLIYQLEFIMLKIGIFSEKASHKSFTVTSQTCRGVFDTAEADLESSRVDCLTFDL